MSTDDITATSTQLQELIDDATDRKTAIDALLTGGTSSTAQLTQMSTTLRTQIAQLQALKATADATATTFLAAEPAYNALLPTITAAIGATNFSVMRAFYLAGKITQAQIATARDEAQTLTGSVQETIGFNALLSVFAGVEYRVFASA